jgi:hypothetical protein
VANVYQVVEFRSPLDASFANASAIDARVGLDFDVVFQDGRARLQDLVPEAGIVFGEAETIGADHCSVLQHDIVS